MRRMVAALIAAIKDVDKLRIIVMALLEHLSGVFERMKKKIFKSKDLTPGNTNFAFNDRDF